MTAFLPGSGAPTGTVEFLEAVSTDVPGCSNAVLTNGSASRTTNTLTAAGGPYQISAKYGGDRNFNAGISGTISQVVSSGATITSLTNSPSTSVWDQGVTFVASVIATDPRAELNY